MKYLGSRKETGFGENSKIKRRKPSLDPNLLEVPVSQDPTSLVSVDRAVSELRRSHLIPVLGFYETAVMAQAPENLNPSDFRELTSISSGPAAVIITARCTLVLGIKATKGKAVAQVSSSPLDPITVQEISDPLSDLKIDAIKMSCRITDHFLILHS